MKGSLHGIKVLDLSEYLSGPLCTQILADMGAEVIKVENFGGDKTRQMGDGSECNSFFSYINRNKRSITLDYKTPEGRNLFLRLVDRSDILVENYRPLVMKRAGLDYNELKSYNPQLIYAAISGFGQTGPYKDKGGLDLIAQAMGGIMHVTGEEDGPPTLVGLPICDIGTAMWAVQGILAALYERTSSGFGQKIECSLLETAVGFGTWATASWLTDGIASIRQGAKHNLHVPYQRFETQDGYIMIGCPNQVLWERFANVINPNWITDPRYKTDKNRSERRVELTYEIEEILEGDNTKYWIMVLDEVGVPCGAINDYEQVFNDPQVQHLKMVDENNYVRSSVSFSHNTMSIRRGAPKLGEHTDEILKELGEKK